KVSLAEALKHPNWQIGPKITIDSATLMNKGLEVIEAFHLYGVAKEQIEVVLHPQSLVHSLVRFKDGSLLAQLASADMKLPLAHCLAWPKRLPNVVEPLILPKLTELTFAEPDETAFPCLALAKRALSERGGMCVVLNSANEEAVRLFLAQKCRFSDIPKLIKAALDAHAASIPGHEPFCPPLVGQVDNLQQLSRRVAGLEQKIHTLAARTRALVDNLTERELGAC
ncbi:MAG: 1-deoxy-D-xylulose-5-phosphate reductoisomerase, partial [Desulfovibrio sp.]|nr:1-deoxy-D-xylulose-5-phosphate reductoisomerase [Desulfovibrio sp.]